MRDEFDTIQNRRVQKIILNVGFIVFYLFTHSSVLYAASNIFEVPTVLSLPLKKSDLDSTLAKYLGQTFASGYDINQSVSDFIVRDPFEIRLSGIHISGSLRGRTEIDSRGVIGEAVLQNLKISIDRISIHTIIRTTVGGVDARIRLDAECTNTSVDWKSAEVPVFLRAEIKVGPLQPTLDIEGLTLSSQDLSEKPEMVMNCTGPSGIEAILRDQAWNTLMSRWTDVEFLREIQSAIEESVNAGLRPGGEGFSISPVAAASMKPGIQSAMKLQLKASSYKSDSRGAHLIGFLRLELDRPAQESPPFVNTEALIPAQDVKSLTVSVSTNAAESLLQSYFSPGVWNHWVEGREIAGFRDLMSSRFSQFFAFPALMDFPKDAPMAFSASFTDRLELSCTSRGDLRLNAPVGAWLVVQNNSQLGFKPLVYFTMPTVMDVRKAEIGRPTVTIRQIALSSVFHKKYLEEDRPNTSIAHEMILDRIQPTIETELDSFFATSQLVQAVQGLVMGCDSNSQIMRVSTP